ncbi:MAG: acyltransferase family protein, partial [Frankia sp.]
MVGGSRHWPALDGLRAIAVLAVLLYHAGVTWLPGGLLGVDLFFVLSGFLITGLLLGEWNRSGRIDLARFWGRRARRLLPALLVLLLAVCAYARFVASPTQAASLRDDGLATLFYVGNWRFALSHQGYFDTTAPSPLRHTWSLAVEEQFYLVWPLVVILVLGLASRRAPKKRRAPRPAARLLRRVALVGAVGSAATAAVMSTAGVNDSRIYYGTDTRSQALFVGAALAATLVLRGEPTGRAKRAILATAGAVAMGAVLVVFATVGGQSTGLYQGGFLALAVAVVVALASVVMLPASPLARALSVPPLRYVGRISYGLYLYHWPLFLTMTAGRTHLTGHALLGARFAATFVVAAVSARFVEQPIRAGTFRIPRPRAFAPAPGAAVAVAVMGTTTLNHAPASPGGGRAVSWFTMGLTAALRAANLLYVPHDTETPEDTM